MPFRLALALIGLAYSSSAARAQTSPLFESQEVLEVSLRADLSEMLNDVGDDSTAYRASLTYAVEGSDSVLLPLKIQVRGNYRRRPENCSFPPIRLDFPKERTAGTLFEGQNRLKLVTHCQDGKPEYEENLLVEYLVYRLYNVLTDASFRVRLARITYEDETETRPSITRMGFIIEENGRMAARLGGKMDDRSLVPDKDVDSEARSRLFLFEYFIGNIDWEIRGGQNVDRVRVGKRVIPVPYDFDFAGLISPAYRDPLPKLGLGALRNTLFSSYCGTQKDLGPAIGEYLENEATIRDLFANQPLLSAERKTEIGRKLERNFRILKDTERIEQEFVRPCRVG